MPARDNKDLETSENDGGDTNSSVSNSSSNRGSTPYTKQEKIILVSALIGQFLANCCVSLPAPFLPKMDESHNLDSSMTGWILGLLPLGQLFLCPVFAKLIPCFGAHTVLVSGLFLCGGATFLFGTLEYLPLPAADEGVDVPYLVLALVLRITQSIGTSALITSAMTFLSVTFRNNITSVMSYSETTIGLGVLCGPAIGSAMFKAGGFMLTFASVGGGMIIGAVIVSCLLPFNVGSQSDESGKASYRQILTNLDIVLSFVFTALGGTIWSSIDPILEPELRNKFHLAPEISALTFLLLSVTYTITALLIGKAFGRWKSLDAYYVIGFGVAFAGANYMLIGPSPLFPSLQRPLWLMLLCIAIIGISLGFILVPTFNLAYDGNSNSDGAEGDGTMNTSTLAMISALWASAYSIGDFFGPTFSGVVAKYSNFGWTMTYYGFGCLATLVFIIAIIAYRYIRRCKRVESEETHTTINETSSSSEDESSPLLGSIASPTV